MTIQSSIYKKDYKARQKDSRNAVETQTNAVNKRAPVTPLQQSLRYRNDWLNLRPELLHRSLDTNSIVNDI